MLARGDRPGRIGNISSMLAYFSMPNFAVYASTRAFVRNFSEAAAADLARTNVSVTTVCFGGVDTEFNAVAGIEVRPRYRPFLMSADRAARAALRGILRGRRTVVPGLVNKLGLFFAWLLPRRVASWNVKTMLGPPKS
jgi:hypothetical protein